MTSVVRASAHCGDKKEMVMQVLRTIPNSESEIVREVILQDGENGEVVVYDDLQVVSFERLKA